MATETTNYGLIKPDKTDFYTVDDFNNNMDMIDENMSKFAILEDVGEPLEPEIPTDSDLLGGQPKSYFEGLIKGIGDRVGVIEGVYPYLSNPNLLINADFQIWQRGTSITTRYGMIYHADRWRSNQTIENGVNYSKSDNGLVIESIPGNTGGGIHQLIENGYKFRGKTVTMSASIDGIVYSHTFVLPVDAYVQQYVTESVMFQVSTEIATKTATALITIFEEDSTHTINWVKLELGEIATPFIPRLFAEELALCQRYYIDSMPKAIIMQGYNNSGSRHLLGNVFYPVEMRTIPTLKIYGTSNGALNHIRNTSTGADILLTSIAFNSLFTDAKGFSLIVIDGFTPVDGAFYDFIYTLDAEIY